MKRFMTLILLILSLGLTSCSNYQDGYNDGYGDGWSDGDYDNGYDQGQADYYQLVMRAVDYAFWMRGHFSNNNIDFLKLGKDDPDWAVYRLNFGSGWEYRIFKMSDWDPSDGWLGSWFNPDENAFWGVDPGPNGTFTCHIGSCYSNYYSGGYLPPSIDIHNMVFEQAAPTPKDVEKLGALADALNLESARTTLVEQFGLSEERSKELAYLAVNWKKVSSKRAMTNDDIRVISNELLGSDISKWEIAVRKSFQGDSDDYEDLIKRAAKVNGITPEHVYEIINTFMD